MCDNNLKIDRPSKAGNAMRPDAGVDLAPSTESTLSRLWAMLDECSEPDWDGSGAAPLNVSAVAAAEIFIRALPEGVPLPEVAPEPDGSVSLDWIKSRHRQLSLSIGGMDRVAYAWHDGTDRGHAVASFDGTKIPNRILEGIKSLML